MAVFECKCELIVSRAGDDAPPRCPRCGSPAAGFRVIAEFPEPYLRGLDVNPANSGDSSRGFEPKDNEGGANRFGIPRPPNSARIGRVPDRNGLLNSWLLARHL